MRRSHAGAVPCVRGVVPMTCGWLVQPRRVPAARSEAAAQWSVRHCRVEPAATYGTRRPACATLAAAVCGCEPRCLVPRAAASGSPLPAAATRAAGVLACARCCPVPHAAGCGRHGPAASHHEAPSTRDAHASHGTSVVLSPPTPPWPYPLAAAAPLALPRAPEPRAARHAQRELQPRQSGGGVLLAEHRAHATHVASAALTPCAGAVVSAAAVAGSRAWPVAGPCAHATPAVRSQPLPQVTVPLLLRRDHSTTSRHPTPTRSHLHRHPHRHPQPRPHLPAPPPTSRGCRSRPS